MPTDYHFIISTFIITIGWCLVLVFKNRVLNFLGDHFRIAHYILAPLYFIIMMAHWVIFTTFLEINLPLFQMPSRQKQSEHYRLRFQAQPQHRYICFSL